MRKTIRLTITLPDHTPAAAMTTIARDVEVWLQQGALPVTPIAVVATAEILPNVAYPSRPMPAQTCPCESDCPGEPCGCVFPAAW